MENKKKSAKPAYQKAAGKRKKTEFKTPQAKAAATRKRNARRMANSWNCSFENPWV